MLTMRASKNVKHVVIYCAGCCSIAFTC